MTCEEFRIWAIDKPAAPRTTGMANMLAEHARTCRECDNALIASIYEKFKRVDAEKGTFPKELQIRGIAK